MPQWGKAVDEDLQNDIPHLMEALAAVKGVQELARSGKAMGDSLQSYVAFESESPHARQLFDRYDAKQLEILFGVSGVKSIGNKRSLPELQNTEWSFQKQVELLGENVRVWVYAPQLAKCARCWRYAAPVHADDGQALCGRCEGVIEDLKVRRPELFV